VRLGRRCDQQGIRLQRDATPVRPLYSWLDAAFFKSVDCFESTFVRARKAAFAPFDQVEPMRIRGAPTTLIRADSHRSAFTRVAISIATSQVTKRPILKQTKVTNILFNRHSPLNSFGTTHHADR
jgi:hypothetical protein